MTPHDWIELGALVLSGIVALGSVTWGIVGYVNRSVSVVDDRRSKNTSDLHVKIDRQVNSLDEKFNSVSKEISNVKDNYARRDDMAIAMDRMERMNGQLVEAIDSLRDRFDRGFMEFTRIIAGAVGEGGKGLGK